MGENWKPWKWYPELWPTEAKFWSWLRGGFRQGVWNKSPIKLSFKNGNVSKPPDGYTGKAKSGAYCGLSGQWEGKSKLEVDHIEGNTSLLCEEDILSFIKHLVPPPDSLMLVTKEAHKIKSYAERMGLSYEEAIIGKKVIAFFKQPTKEVNKLLEEMGASAEDLKNKETKKSFYKKKLEETK